LHRTPTCMDGRMNGMETGIDCGGMCARACIEEVEDVSVLWARSFPVVPGRYNAVAYLTNHNKNKMTESMHYRFRFADKDNLYLGERQGETFVPPNGNFAVFEGGIEFKNSAPVYTTFEFDKPEVWLQVTEDRLSTIKVLVSDIQLKNEDTAPELSAKIKNTSLFSIPEINIITILYDASHNAVNISRTLEKDVKGEEVRPINFTWPQSINTPIVQKEIIPEFNIMRVGAK
jgi:hypothetical protein